MPGFYRVKLVKGGPWVAVRIWLGEPRDPVTGDLLDRSPRHQAVRNAIECDVWQVWPNCCGEPISEEEYHKLLANPPIDPLIPINLNAMSPVF